MIFESRIVTIQEKNTNFRIVIFLLMNSSLPQYSYALVFSVRIADAFSWKMSKQYLILSLIIYNYSNVSALNGAFLKVSGRQYIQPGFIINFFLKSCNANTNSNCPHMHMSAWHSLRSQVRLNPLKKTLKEIV